MREVALGAIELSSEPHEERGYEYEYEIVAQFHHTQNAAEVILNRPTKIKIMAVGWICRLHRHIADRVLLTCRCKKYFWPGNLDP